MTRNVDEAIEHYREAVQHRIDAAQALQDAHAAERQAYQRLSQADEAEAEALHRLKGALLEGIMIDQGPELAQFRFIPMQR